MEKYTLTNNQQYIRNTITSFIIPCLLLMAIHFFLGPVSSVIWINGFHNNVLDEVFKNITFLGDGIILLPIAFFMLFRGIQFSMSFILASVLQGCIIIFCKKILFHNAARPIQYLENEAVHFVPDVVVHHWNTFPSGHSTTAFGLFMLISLLHNNLLIQRITLMIAILVGLSRIYLLQHFALDVAVGGLLGIGTSLLSYQLLISNNNKPTWMLKRIKIFKMKKQLRIAFT